MKDGDARHKEGSTPGSRRGTRGTKGTTPGAIHPVIIYPFQQPANYTDLESLYGLIAELNTRKETYYRPITVIDRKTHYRLARDKRFLKFRDQTIAPCSDILDAWCVDTCQMWYSGLGMAYEQGSPNDVYWLIPGDFDYGSACGREVLGRLHDLPEICLELAQDVCIGEICTNQHHSKQLIDCHGTFALLYNWFPAEASEIRQYTERPRSEFFAIRHSFLGEMLLRRWYAYEQTMVLLLHAVLGRKRITRFSVGNISDLPEGRESLASAIQQVERIERVVKSLWRERHGTGPGWAEHYRKLEAQSAEVRRAAVIVLEKLLI